MQYMVLEAVLEAVCCPHAVEGRRFADTSVWADNLNLKSSNVLHPFPFFPCIGGKNLFAVCSCVNSRHFMEVRQGCQFFCILQYSLVRCTLPKFSLVLSHPVITCIAGRHKQIDSPSFAAILCTGIYLSRVFLFVCFLSYNFTCMTYMHMHFRCQRTFGIIESRIMRTSVSSARTVRL